MLLGIGTDILKMDRIQTVAENPEDPFIKRVFTQKEMTEASVRENKGLYYATRFAGKEAVFKSLSIGAENIRLQEIEILSSENGEAYVTLYGKIAEHARNKGIQSILISLSYDTDYAVAFAVANGD